VTENEWNACTDPEAMLSFLHDSGTARGWCSCSCCRVRCRRGKACCPTYRKLRLFSCACCQRILHFLPDVANKVLGELESFIEGAGYTEAPFTEFDQARRSRYPKERTPDDGAWTALYCALHRRWSEPYDESFAAERWRYAGRVAECATESACRDEKRTQSAILREIVGNPFRPVTIDPAWQTVNVLALAQSIYTDRAFERMPILADALEDAGCTNADILDHCRRPGEHARGCWVVDLLLDKK
jgi:hypothetical protein